MKKEISDYIDTCIKNTNQSISSFLNTDNAIRLAQNAFIFYFSEKSLPFEKYYVENINNRETYFSTDNYFRVFKHRYALQGIDGSFLNMLEKEKATILKHIDNGELSKLYFDFFANAKIQHGEKIVSKNLGSFFSKLVHTFCPDKYCALDNPIKKFFGLQRESFYVAFIIVSQAYQEWAKENHVLMQEFRNELEHNLVAKPYSSKMTNIKLLDMIFWHHTNVVLKNE